VRAELQRTVRETSVEELVLDKAGNAKSDSASSPRCALFVIPTRRGDGFRASIRGSMLDLADPGLGPRLAPTPDELLILSIASELAWSARRFLRIHALVGEISVSAEWQTHADQRVRGITVSVTVSNSSKATAAALSVALEDNLASRSIHTRIHLQVRSE
jgi:hypothetical protein